MTNTQRYTLIITLLFSVFYALAQQNDQVIKSLDPLLKASNKHVLNNDFDAAIATSGKLVQKALKENNYYYTSLGYKSLGTIYLSMMDTVNSFDYYNKSLVYAKKTEVDTIIAKAYNDIGSAILKSGGNERKALINFEQSLTHNIKGGKNDKEILQNNINLAWTYLNLRELSNALPYLNISRETIEGNANIDPFKSIHLDLLRGRYHLYRNSDLKRAINILESVVDRALKANHITLAVEAQSNLSTAYEQQGDLRKAITSIKKEQELKAESEKIIQQRQLAFSNAKTKNEQFEQDALLVQKEQLLSNDLITKSKGRATLYFIISLALLIGLLSVFLLYKSRQKFVKRLSEKNLELIKAKENAERLSNLKTQFFSTVSHELRTPLYGVIGLSSILLDDDALKTHKDDLKSLKFSADYLLALINDVLTLNKADVQGMSLEKTPFSLKKLVKNITNSFSFSLQQNNNKINVVIDEAVPERLIGDSIKLSQILMNLVGNAVKFNENGTIEIIIKLVEKTKEGIYRTQFFIKDNGIGIPKEKQASIFEEFSQVENKNYNYQGTGLGLPIVKKLLAIYGSTIELDSDVGRGAIFSFILPLEENPTPKEVITEEELSNNMRTPSFENIHILIVDDNKINQKVTQKILQKRNFKTSLADDGQEAVAMTQKNKYALILMDIHMPKMGGVEATKAIRSFDARTPIIALTAVEIEEARVAILESGMNDIILKPYDVAQFLTVILRNLTTAFNSLKDN